MSVLVTCEIVVVVATTVMMMMMVIVLAVVDAVLVLLVVVDSWATAVIHVRLGSCLVLAVLVEASSHHPLPYNK